MDIIINIIEYIKDNLALIFLNMVAYGFLIFALTRVMIKPKRLVEKWETGIKTINCKSCTELKKQINQIYSQDINSITCKECCGDFTVKKGKYGYFATCMFCKSTLSIYELVAEFIKIYGNNI